MNAPMAYLNGTRNRRLPKRDDAWLRTLNVLLSSVTSAAPGNRERSKDEKPAKGKQIDKQRNR
jgi:hypothetical protein